MPKLKQLDSKFSFDLDKQQIVNTVSGEAIPDDEPIFLFRARDNYALAAIMMYQRLCSENNAPASHIESLTQSIRKFAQFATQHPERLKQPGITEHVALDAKKEAKS